MKAITSPISFQGRSVSSVAGPDGIARKWSVVKHGVRPVDWKSGNLNRTNHPPPEPLKLAITSLDMKLRVSQSIKSLICAYRA
jgi:hypothetical protein